MAHSCTLKYEISKAKASAKSHMMEKHSAILGPCTVSMATSLSGHLDAADSTGTQNREFLLGS